MFVSAIRPASFSSRTVAKPQFGQTAEAALGTASPNPANPDYLWQILKPELEREHFKDQHPQVNSDFWKSFGQIMKQSTPLQRDVLAWEKGRYFNPLATPEQLQFICQADQFAATTALEARRQELARSGDPEKACKVFAETIFSTYGNLFRQNPVGRAYNAICNQANELPPVSKQALLTGQLNQLI